MAPGGFVISKLALQATVDDEVLKGLLCMKVGISLAETRPYRGIVAGPRPRN